MFFILSWRTFPLFLLSLLFSLLFLLLSLFLSFQEIIQSQFFLIFQILFLFLLFFTFLTIFLFPIPSKEELNGKYQRIGSSSFSIPISLPLNSQLYQNNLSYPLTVQCWFPISNSFSFFDQIRKYFNLRNYSTLWSSGNPQSQTKEILQLLRCVAESASLPAILFSHLTLAKTNAEFIDYHSLQLKSLLSQSSNPSSSSSSSSSSSFPSLSSQESQFPIVIYSHGMWSWRQISSSTFEMLASNGYVVFSVDHLPSAMITRPYPEENNNSVPFDYFLPSHIQPGSIEERIHYNGGVDRRCQEIIHLIDFLCKGREERGGEEEVSEKLNLDITQIHLFGHSFGGGTVAAVACRDSRITSCVLCKLNISHNYLSIYLIYL